MPVLHRRVRDGLMDERTVTTTDDLVGEVTVVDVYDIASDIGKECEKIIDRYGADAVTSLMPKVIGALELLEGLATKNERENTQVSELRSKIAQLENDKLERAEYRQRFEKELETIEEQWRSESKELVNLVARLQDENRRLAREHGRETPPPPASPSDADGALLRGLRASLEKQRDELKAKEKLLHDKTRDVETLKSQVERLTAQGRELRRKHRSLQAQVRTLCDERADFLVRLQDQQRDIAALRQRLGLAQKENEDLAKVRSSLVPFVASSSVVVFVFCAVRSSVALQQGNIRSGRSRSATFHDRRVEGHSARKERVEGSGQRPGGRTGDVQAEERGIVSVPYRGSVSVFRFVSFPFRFFLSVFSVKTRSERQLLNLPRKFYFFPRYTAIFRFHGCMFVVPWTTTLPSKAPCRTNPTMRRGNVHPNRE